MVGAWPLQRSRGNLMLPNYSNQHLGSNRFYYSKCLTSNKAKKLTKVIKTQRIEIIGNKVYPLLLFSQKQMSWVFYFMRKGFHMDSYQKDVIHIRALTSNNGNTHINDLQIIGTTNKTKNQYKYLLM